MSKFCIDCRWSKQLLSSPNVVDYSFVCTHPVFNVTSLVTGKATALSVPCTNNRNEGGKCGPNGKLWENKP